MATQINAAAMQALAAYGGPPRVGAGAGNAQLHADERRETVRHQSGISVEFSADARATLIAIQSTASAGGNMAAAVAQPASTAPHELPGSRVNLTV